MKKLLIDRLNEVFEPIYKRAERLKKALKSGGHQVESGWYPLHSVEYDGGFLTEYFPIPVLLVDGVCDIGVDLDELFIEGKLKREQAAALDLTQLGNWRFQLYGAEDYLTNLHDAAQILASGEEEICLCVYCAADAAVKDVLEVVDFFASHGAYMSRSNSQ